MRLAMRRTSLYLHHAGESKDNALLLSVKRITSKTGLQPSDEQRSVVAREGRQPKGLTVTEFAD
jgi:hypothetical protein